MKRGRGCGSDSEVAQWVPSNWLRAKNIRCAHLVCCFFARCCCAVSNAHEKLFDKLIDIGIARRYDVVRVVNIHVRHKLKRPA